MDETIELNVPNNTSNWLETVDRKYQNRRKWFGFSTYNVSNSTFGRFAFILSKIGQIQVIDTYNGISSQLEFVKNNDKNVVKKLNMSSYQALKFYPITSSTGVIFWTEDISDGEIDRLEKLYTARVQLNFSENTFQQTSDALELKTLTNFWVSELIPNQSVILTTSCNELGIFVDPFEMQQFDLIGLKFIGPKALYRPEEWVFEKFMSTFYNNCFYDFGEEGLGYDSRLFLSNKIFLPDFFGSINCYDPNVNNGKQEKIELMNDLEFLDIVGVCNRDEVCFKGVWINNSLYFHATKLTTHFDSPIYHHYFAVLNLETLMWRQINFKFDTQNVTSIPMGMSITNESQMLLIKSISVLCFYKRTGSIEYLPLYYNFINVGGHAHCSAEIIPLRRPNSLYLTSLQFVNKMTPNWKDTESGKIISNSLGHKPLSNDHQHSCHSDPIIYKLTTAYFCNQCKSNGVSNQPRKMSHFLKNFYSIVEFLKYGWHFWLLIPFIILWISNSMEIYFNLSSIDQNVYDRITNFNLALCQYNGGLTCLISEWLDVEVHVLNGIVHSFGLMLFYLFIYFVTLMFVKFLGKCYISVYDFIDDICDSIALKKDRRSF